MGKKLSIIGLILSIVLAILSFFLMFFPDVGLIFFTSLFVNFILNLVVLIKRLEGKLFAVIGLILNLLTFLFTNYFITRII